MRNRVGRGALGCLFMLLLLVVGAYFGFGIGEVYLRNYRFQDAMMQQARFANRESDRTIITRLRAKADSLELPEEARNIRVRRRIGRITIWSEYTQTVELPLFTRDIRFEPTAEAATVAPRSSP